MPQALLLSPDDQAVSAITAVLEEMSVTCERPLDGVSAAKKLNSHNFDLVLVDCENLPAAKLIFDVCRRGSGAHNPVPIAIVDGRAGLPTAFRLGAELILTKPVAKDQARSTVRTAVGRVKKDEPARPQQTETNAAEPAPVEVSAETASAATLLSSYESTSELATSPSAESRAMAAAAPAQGPSFQESAPVAASTLATASMSSTATAPEIKSAPARSSGSAVNEPKFASIESLSEDPVLAELEKAESEPVPTHTAAPVFSAYAEPPKEKRKVRGPLVALLALGLLCAGLYAAWMTLPAFRTIAQPQVEQVLALAGMAHKSPAPVAVSAPAKPEAPSAPAPASENNPTMQAGSDASAGNTAATSGAATTATPATGAAPPAVSSASATSSSAATPDKNTGDTKSAAQNPSDAKTAGNGSAPESGAATPGDQSPIILSSKGAEKRLIHSVQPTYPAGSHTAEGTIVLKAFVDENGQVADAQVVEGNAVLAQAAVSAVKQWKYRPYLRDGKAKPFQTIVLVDFQRQ